jgi:hypothetical protein
MAISGILCLTLLAGCGRAKPDVVIPKELSLVEGQVTLDGKPLAGALVLFLPPAESDPWRESKGVTDEKGHYKLTFFKETQGAIPGEHTVRITCPDPKNIERQIVPAKYNSESTLKRTVEKGSNEINFDLATK